MSSSVSQSRIGWRVTYLESAETLLIKIIAPMDLNAISWVLIIFIALGYFFFGPMKSDFDSGFTCVGILMALFPLYVLLWNLVGKEIITVDDNKIVIRRTILGIGFQQTYQLSLVRNIRASLANPALFTLEYNMQEWGLAGGSIAFDYQGRVCRFGIILRKQHADVLVTKINQYLPSSVQNSSTLAVKT